jgi:hypothetical protein
MTKMEKCWLNKYIVDKQNELDKCKIHYEKDGDKREVEFFKAQRLLLMEIKEDFKILLGGGD